jgi:hypothetical protein
VRATLDRYGLAAPSAHAPLADIQTKLDQTIETAKAVGHRFLICPYLVDKQGGHPVRLPQSRLRGRGEGRKIAL